MEKRISSRGIIIEDDYVYLLFRRKINQDGTIKEYYVIPGGGINEGETLEENVTRELNEELSIDIAIDGYLGMDEGDDYIAHYYRCSIVKGIPTLGGEELERCTKENYYEVQKVAINDLDKIEVFSKDMIIKAYNKEYIKV